MLSTAFRPIGFVFALLLLIATQNVLHAASVKQVSVEQLWAESNLVFQGRVLSIEARPGKQYGNIYTYVRFQVENLIKGNLEASDLELVFEGGSYNGLTLEVPGVVIPQLNEEVILFVENPNRIQINPVYGWHQGFFRVHIDRATGQKYVMTESGRWVTALRPDTNQERVLISTGAALGVIAEVPSESNTAMLVEEFVSRLRAIGEAGS